MNLNDFPDLATAQAQPVTVDTKQVGSGQARAFFINEDTDPDGPFPNMKLWSLFTMLSEGDKTHAMYPQASGIVITASDAQSYFGMDETKADGMANRQAIVGLVTLKIMTQACADRFIAKTMSTTYPFADATQEDFDNAQVVEIAQTKTMYGGNDIQKHHVRINGKNVRVFAYLDEPATKDTDIAVSVFGCSSHKDNTVDANFVRNNAIRLVINVKAGELGGEVELKGNTARWLRFTGVSNVVGAYHLDVEQA